MRLKDLAGVLRSPVGSVQRALLYVTSTRSLIVGSVERMVTDYPDAEVTRIGADESHVVIVVKEI